MPFTPQTGARALLCAGLLFVPWAAQAQNAAETLYVRALAATCANCHGTQGKAVAGSAVRALAGMSQANIVGQMQGFRDGSLPATVMHQIAKGYTPAQIESLAAYFAAQK